MSASRPRVLKRVTEILNLCLPGTYSATLSTLNKTRNALAIEDFVDEASLQILKAIAERPNEFRYSFLADNVITASGNQMPLHLGPPASIKIRLSNGGEIRSGERRDYRKIESFRENINGVYDTTARHDEAGSSLSGYYDIWDDKFYFTGYSATLSLARLPVRADNLTLIPEILESVWIHLAAGEAAKVGTGGYETNLIAEYARRGMAELEEFKTGGRIFTEIDEPKPQTAVHQLVK